jgi:hypothetical protein
MAAIVGRMEASRKMKRSWAHPENCTIGNHAFSFARAEPGPRRLSLFNTLITVQSGDSGLLDRLDERSPDDFESRKGSSMVDAN